MSITSSLRTKLLLLLVLLGLIAISPLILPRLLLWQQAFHQLIATQLRHIEQHQQQAGLWLMLLSFLYGVFHAIGPGHGKFILASYLATHSSQLKQSMRLSFLASLLQGVVAVSLCSLIVVALRLSSAQFKLSQLWLERGALLLLLLLGLRWCYQSVPHLLRHFAIKRGQKNQKKSFKIKGLTPLAARSKSQPRLSPPSFSLAQKKMTAANGCSCGHQHLPTANQLAKQNQWLIILSIGLRPCSGAIVVLFLSYMLNIYFWGIASAMVMAVGTGLTVSAFALLVQYGRKQALRLGSWYLSTENLTRLELSAQCVVGISLVIVALNLLWLSMQPQRALFF